MAKETHDTEDHLKLMARLKKVRELIKEVDKVVKKEAK